MLGFNAICKHARGKRQLKTLSYPQHHLLQRLWRALEALLVQRNKSIAREFANNVGI